MTELTIGVIDYGVGNLASISQALHQLGYRCRVSREPEVLDAVDLLLLPGVGAFPAAMESLHRYDLVEYLRRSARLERPMVGICLGMQLLADTSSEHRLTEGLGLIPGSVSPLHGHHWHIGWNTMEVLKADPLLQPSDGHSLYFNHSYVFEAALEYQIGVARLDVPLVAAVRRGMVVGLQFHPEKSQAAGRQLLRNVIEGLCHA